MSRRASKNLSLNSSDDDDTESTRSSKITSKGNSSSSSSEISAHSNRPKSVDKKQYSRSSSRTKKSSDETSSEKSHINRPASRPQPNLRVSEQNSESDSASDSTVKKSYKSSNESFDRPRDSRTSDRKRQILKSSSSSRSRSNSPADSEKKADSDSDVDSTTMGSSILKIKIESKPPIDKDRLTRKSRQSYFEKPDSDSESDSKISSNRSKNSKKMNYAVDTDSQDSCNDMTDVSSLSSPKEKNKINFISDKYDEEMSVQRGRSTFYSALHQKSNTRPNSVNFNFTQNNPNSTDFSEKTYGRELMRIEAQQRRMFNEFLKENGGKSRMIERPLRLTSSAINRQRDQQRIEKENQMILKRLLSVKSSKEVRRDNQLKDYEKIMGISDLNLTRNSVKSGLSTKRSLKSSVANSRVPSAKSNRRQTPFEYSNRTFSLSRKPEWNSRW